MTTDLVVKVGGSLYDLPDLGPRLRAWLDAQAPRRIVLLPGGGAAADWIRHVDALAHIGEEPSHWLALRALTLAAHVLAARLSGATVIEHLNERETAWRRGLVPILDPHAFTRADEARPDHLPHTWDVTSDSLAARVAVVGGFAELVLLKSSVPPDPVDWREVARGGFVDAAFPAVVASAPLRVTAVNFRQWRPASSAAAPPASAP